METAFNRHEIYQLNPITQDVSWYSGGALGHIDESLADALFTTPNGIMVNTIEIQYTFLNITLKDLE